MCVVVVVVVEFCGSHCVVSCNRKLLKAVGLSIIYEGVQQSPNFVEVSHNFQVGLEFAGLLDQNTRFRCGIKQRVIFNH